jgi:hypothetical protein
MMRSLQVDDGVDLRDVRGDVPVPPRRVAAQAALEKANFETE